MIFWKWNRENFKEQYPELKLTELSKLLGIKWKELSPQEKEHFQLLSNTDKERYKMYITF